MTYDFDMALKILAFVVRNVLDWCDLGLPYYFCQVTRWMNYTRLQLCGSYSLQDESFGEHGCVITWIRLTCQLKSDEVIVYLHGGGFTLRDGCDLLFSDSFLSNWSKCTDSVAPVVCGIQYSLADEGYSSFPTAIDQILKVQDVLTSRGYKIIGIVGDSAGGNLAITSLLKSQDLALRSVNSQTPPCFVGISPACDLHMTSDGFACNKNKDILSLRWINRCRYAYICGKPPLRDDASVEERQLCKSALENPLISPVYASDQQLAALPPMLVYGGTDEVLIDDIRWFVMRVAGLAASEPEYVEGGPGSMHIYPFLMSPGKQREAVFKRMINFILKHGCQRVGMDV